jgi:hypothetical protein
MKKILVLLVLLFGSGLTGFAQNEADVRRYTANYFSGTARFQSMGGAFGALGGDMSSIHINPAAVGVYRFGEISFTPGYEFTTIGAGTEFGTQEADKSKLVVNNIGFVLANEVNDPKWRSINFSVSYNRINTFNDLVRLTGESTAINGLAGDFLFRAQDRLLGELNDFGTGLAWDTFVIDNANYGEDENGDPVPIDDGEYVMSFDEQETIRTTQTSERDGRLSETALTLGANYDDKFYIGFGLGFQDVQYQTTVETSERPVGDPQGSLSSYTFTERLESEGLGVNARLGMIYRFQNMRFGASVRTPTVFSMTDNFNADMSSRLVNDNGTLSNVDSESPAGFFEYRIRTPWHFMGSVSGVIGKKAILSAQYERVDFGGGELRNSGGADEDFSQVNSDISQFFSSSDIFRLGGEYRINKSFSARAGYAYFANPIEINEQSTDANLNRQEISFGIGFRKAAWYADLAYSKILFSELYPYTDLNRSTLDYDQNVFSLTVGFRM